MLLYDLLATLDKGFRILIRGYDKELNIVFNVWNGIRWQLTPEGVIENCNVNNILSDWANDRMIIECDLHFDTWKGYRIYGFKH